MSGLSRKQASVFFFEKKKQKTFLRWAWSWQPAASRTNKSFLVLFFKKEHSFLPCLRFARLALLCGVLLLAACGFHPVYAPAADGADGPAAQGLAAINVGVITERPGQLLRQALQERFERSGLAVPRRYDLFVTYSISSEAVSIQQDSSNTRVRLVGRADYRLLAQDATRTTLASGSARSVDALNVFDQQFFALDLETETIQRRIADDMASQIALQLAIYFNKHALAAAK